MYVDVSLHAKPRNSCMLVKFVSREIIAKLLTIGIRAALVHGVIDVAVRCRWSVVAWRKGSFGPSSVSVELEAQPTAIWAMPGICQHSPEIYRKSICARSFVGQVRPKYGGMSSA